MFDCPEGTQHEGVPVEALRGVGIAVVIRHRGERVQPDADGLELLVAYGMRIPGNRPLIGPDGRESRTRARKSIVPASCDTIMHELT